MNRRGIATLLVVLGCFLLLLCMGCGRTINRAAERRIRDALPDILGPARQYKAHVANAPERTVQGRLASVEIDGDGVQLSNGLILDHLHLDLKGVEVDTGQKRVKQIREALFTATIRQADLDEYLAGESPIGETLKEVRLTLMANNQVTLTGKRLVLGLGVPFRMTGPLRVVTPQKIELDSTRLVVIGIPISGGPLHFLKQRFESAMDLSTLPIPIQVTQVQTEKGKLILSGTADVVAILQRTK